MLSTCIDRSVIPPFGLFGGADGAPNLIYLKRESSNAWEPVNPRLSNLPLRGGDVVRIETGIGGGFGSPLERDPRAVAEDVADGYLIREDAEAAYGVVLDDRLAVDENATAQLRQRREGEVAPTGEPDGQSYPKREPTFEPLPEGS